MRTNLFEKDVQPVKEQLAQVRTVCIGQCFVISMTGVNT